MRKQAMREGKDTFLWDTELAGFAAKATASGHVSWLVQKWLGGRGGKAKRVVLGHNPPMDVDEARTEASTALGDVRRGVDLVDRKTKARVAKREALNAIKLGDAVERYLKRKSKPGSYWTEVRNKFERTIVPELGKDSTVASITRAEVRSLIDTKLDKGQQGSARYLFAVVRPFFKWCVDQDIIAKSPIDDTPAPKPLAARDRTLSDAEIKAFWSACSAEHIFGPFYRLLLLTAQRREEVGAMQWSELDYLASTWTIPKERTKNAKEHIVHLSPKALDVLESIQRHEGSNYIFTTTLNEPISGYGKPKARLDKAMGIVIDPHAEGYDAAKLWRVHDLRRTAASGMAALGFQPHIIERVLNHVSGAQGGLVSVYQRYEYLEERKRAIEAWGQHVEALVSDTHKTANVIQFKR